MLETRQRTYAFFPLVPDEEFISGIPSGWRDKRLVYSISYTIAGLHIRLDSFLAVDVIIFHQDGALPSVRIDESSYRELNNRGKKQTHSVNDPDLKWAESLCCEYYGEEEQSSRVCKCGDRGTHPHHDYVMLES